MKIALVTTGDPTANPRTKPLVSRLMSAGHDVFLVSPPVKQVCSYVNHIEAGGAGPKSWLGRRVGRATSPGDVVAASAASRGPDLVYPLRDRDVAVADMVSNGFVLSRPGWTQPASRNFVWAGSAHMGLAGGWAPRQAPSDSNLTGHEVHIVARFTATTPAQYLVDALERSGATVVRHDGQLVWDDVPDSATAVLFVESPYPALSVVGSRRCDVPVLFWVHHGEHHQAANIRLADRYSADAVLMAHSWHLAHQYRQPVYPMPFAVPTALLAPARSFDTRDVDVAMVAAGLTSDGGWYRRRQARVREIEQETSLTSVLTYGLTPAEMMKLYGRSKVVINDGGAQHFPITMRMFEAIGAGAALATEPAPGFDELFPIDDHYRTLHTTGAAEIVDIVADPQAAETAAAALAYALDHHTYDRRVTRIVEIASEVDVFRSLPPGGDGSAIGDAVDADADVQSVLVVGDVDFGGRLDDRDVRHHSPRDEYGSATFDAVVIGTGVVDPTVVLCARSYVYVVESDAPQVPMVKGLLAGWTETHIGSVTKLDSAAGSYRIRQDDHPLG